MKRERLYAGVAAAELVLLLWYFRVTGVAVSAQDFIGSFHWTTFHGVFDGARLGFVWAMILSGGIVAALWLALAAGAGAAVLDRLDWKAETPLQRVLISAALGLGIESLALFALAALHLVYPASALALGLALAVFAFRFGKSRKFQWSRPRWPSDEAGEPLLLAALLAAGLLAFHLAGALLPPSSFDELDYQLSLPKLYQLNHGFAATPYSHFSFFPKNINLLFLLGLVSGGAIVAKLFAWALSVLAAAALYAFAAPRLGKRAAGFAAAVFFFTPVIGNQFRVAAPDVGTAFFELSGLFLLLRWLEERSPKTLLLSGVLWGLALGSKYTALPDFAACFVALAWLLRGDDRRKSARVLLAWSAPAVLLWSPWLIKNWWESGNPLNPILSTVLTSRNFFFAGRYKATVDYSVGLGIPNYFPVASLKDAVLLPWRLIVEHNDYNHDLGPFWLLLLPLASLSLKRRPGAWLDAAALVCALCWTWWLALSIHITRYFVAGLALSSLLAGWLLDAVPERGRGRWVLLLPVFLAWTQASARMVVVQNAHKKPWGYLAGRCTLGEYLNAVQTDSPYDAFDFLNEESPPNARVLLFNEFRTFYLERDYLASTPWDHDYWLEMLRESGTPQELLARLHALGITYFLANDNFRLHQSGRGRDESWTIDDLAKEKRFLHRVMKVVFISAEHVWVAQVKDRAS